MKFILLILLITISCQTNNSNNWSYKAKLLPLDSTISENNFDLVETISLYEDEYSILSSVSVCKVFDNSNKLILSDASSLQRIIYDFNSGESILINKPGYEIHNYYALNRLKSKQESYKKIINLEEFKGDYYYIESKDYEKYFTESDIKLIKTTTTSIEILNDTLLFFLDFSTIPCMNENNIKSLDNRTAVTVYDTNFNILNIIPLETFDYIYPIGGKFKLYKSNIVTTVSNYQFKLNDFDSTVTIAMYDLKGNFINNIGYLTDAYTKSGIMYEDFKPQFEVINDDIFIVYPRDKYVYGMNNKILFEFKNLPFSNDSGLTFINDLLIEYFNKNQTNLDMTERMKFLPISVIDIFDRKGNLIVLFYIYDYTDKKEFYFLLQEYTTEGELISHTKLFKDDTNKIYNFFYDAQNDYLCFLRKSKQGWTVEKRSFK